MPGEPKRSTCMIIFWNAAGSEIADLRVVGFVPADKFLPTLERVLR